MTRSLTQHCGVTAALLALASPLAAQSDTIRGDSVFRIEGIRVQAQRPVTTTGGASAIELTLDSLDLPPQPPPRKSCVPCPWCT